MTGGASTRLRPSYRLALDRGLANDVGGVVGGRGGLAGAETGDEGHLDVLAGEQVRRREPGGCDRVPVGLRFRDDAPESAFPRG